MNATVEFNLALILFLPWFAILGALFWIYPRAPRTAARRAFAAASLLASLGAAAGGMAWGLLTADPTAGRMWKQVLATSVAYGLFLAVMTLAGGLRHRWFTGPRATLESLQETSR
jgi:hypothetical protein